MLDLEKYNILTSQENILLEGTNKNNPFRDAYIKNYKRVKEIAKTLRQLQRNEITFEVSSYCDFDFNQTKDNQIIPMLSGTTKATSLELAPKGYNKDIIDINKELTYINYFRALNIFHQINSTIFDADTKLLDVINSQRSFDFHIFKNIEKYLNEPRYEKVITLLFTEDIVNKLKSSLPLFIDKVRAQKYEEAEDIISELLDILTEVLTQLHSDHFINERQPRANVLYSVRDKAKEKVAYVFKVTYTDNKGISTTQYHYITNFAYVYVVDPNYEVITLFSAYPGKIFKYFNDLNLVNLLEEADKKENPEDPTYQLLQSARENCTVNLTVVEHTLIRKLMEKYKIILG